MIRRLDDIGLLMALGTISYQYSTNPKDSAIERIRWFQAAVAADPNDLAALNDLGGALAARGQSDAAADCLKKVIAIDPTIANAHNNLGNLLRNKGQLNEAIDCFRNAVASDTNQSWRTVSIATQRREG